MSRSSSSSKGKPGEPIVLKVATTLSIAAARSPDGRRRKIG